MFPGNGKYKITNTRMELSSAFPCASKKSAASTPMALLSRTTLPWTRMCNSVATVGRAAQWATAGKQTRVPKHRARRARFGNCRGQAGWAGLEEWSGGCAAISSRFLLACLDQGAAAT